MAARRSARAAAAAALLCAAAPAVGHASFGFADLSADSTFTQYYNSTQFTSLKQHLPLADVRFFIPYDVKSSWKGKGTTCMDSPAWSQGPGQSYFNTLISQLKDAKSVGLTPLVVVSPGTGIGGVPAYPDPTNSTGKQDYSCGIKGLLSGVQSYHSNNPSVYPDVTQWEPFNEPDNACVYNDPNSGCQSGTGTVGSGKWCDPSGGPPKAALLWSIFENAESSLRRSDQVAAGVFANSGNTYYVNDYFCELSTNLRQYPTRWSFHDYADVQNQDTSATVAKAFDQNLYNNYNTYAPSQPQPSVWITESGAYLEAGNGIDGSPTKQANAATAFLDLNSSGSVFPGQLAQAYWYMFQPANGDTGWDTGLLAPPQDTGNWSQLSPDGVYGSVSSSAPSDTVNAPGARASICVLEHFPTSSCSSSATEASDWSIQPQYWTGTLTAGQTTVTGVHTTDSYAAPFIHVGNWVTCSDGFGHSTCNGIPSNTKITQVVNNADGTYTWTLSQAPTVSGTYVLTASGFV